MPSPNRVRPLREALALSQVALAERARLTRQSIGAIEAGRATPAVDVALRIARVLGCSVEELFGAAEAAPAVEVELTGVPLSSRVAIARVKERWVGIPLGAEGLRIAADGLVVDARGRRARVSPLRPLEDSRENLVIMGCASGIGVLTDRLHSRGGPGRYLWFASSSGAALSALARGQTHVAGVHVADDRKSDRNVEAVRRAAAPEALVLVTLARWEAGLLTRRGDDRIRGIADVADPALRLIVREKGAGARQLLERQLAAAGASSSVVKDARLVAAGHLDVGRAIAMGSADVGLATRDAALAFGLRFLPLAEERYDLVIPRAIISDARVERLLNVLVSESGRRELESLGYDVSSAGSRVAEVQAA